MKHAWERVGEADLCKECSLWVRTKKVTKDRDTREISRDGGETWEKEPRRFPDCPGNKGVAW